MAALLGPSINEEGLILALDAADRNSYIGSGTSWRDLSGNSYNGTLTNGPTFNSSNGGIIVFDGINNYVDFGSGAINQNLNNFSICFWIKPTSFPSSGASPISIFGKNDSTCGGAGVNIYIRCNGRVIFATPQDNCPGGGVESLSGPLLTLNSWNLITLVYNRLGPSGGAYLIGYNNLTSDIYINNNASYAAVFNNTATLKIGRTGTRNIYQGDFCGGSYASPAYFSGNIATCLVYNKLLTNADVLQNYNATKSRFGL